MSCIHVCVTVGIVFSGIAGSGIGYVQAPASSPSTTKRRYLRPRYRLATTPEQLLTPSKTMDKPVRKRGA
jgi:hypothetical protein